jgi:hypothetical protein
MGVYEFQHTDELNEIEQEILKLRNRMSEIHELRREEYFEWISGYISKGWKCIEYNQTSSGPGEFDHNEMVIIVSPSITTEIPPNKWWEWIKELTPDNILIWDGGYSIPNLKEKYGIIPKDVVPIKTITY